MGAHAAMTRAFNADLQASSAMTVTDFEALRRLAAAEGGRMRRDAHAPHVGRTAAGGPRIIARRQPAGHGRKGSCPADARVTYAVITDAGRERLRTAAEHHLEGLAAIFAERFTPQEVDRLVELLGRLPGAGEDAASCPG